MMATGTGYARWPSRHAGQHAAEGNVAADGQVDALDDDDLRHADRRRWR